MKKRPEPLIGAAIDALVTLIDRLPSEKKDFLSDDILKDATLMRIQETGEYLARIREQFPDYYEKHHDSSWHSLIGLRNIISHGYLQIDDEKVSDIVYTNVPELIKDLKKLL